MQNGTAGSMAKAAPQAAGLAHGVDHDAFDPLTFFAGTVIAHGIFEDRFGRIKRRFSLVLTGSPIADGLAVNEQLTFDEGTVETRSWQLTRAGTEQFVMHGEDIVVAATGTITGSSTLMRYVYRLRVNGRIILVTMRDRMHRINRDRVVNRVTMRKFGIRLGEISSTFERV